MNNPMKKYFHTTLAIIITVFTLLANCSYAQFQASSLSTKVDTHRVHDLNILYDKDGLYINSPQQNGIAALSMDGEMVHYPIQAGKVRINKELSRKGELVFMESEDGTDKYKLYHISARKDGTARIRPIPLWLSLVPPLIAIILALVFKEVILSLFVGIWAGSFIAGGLRIDSLYFGLISFFDVVQKYVLHALNDSGHLSVIVFSIMIGGMVAIISKNGGMAGVVLSLSKYARSPRSTQFITWLLGVAIFFDDYANTLIVGNTMRSVTDKFRISREKLAYIVDSTAAPVSAVAFITTWIGAELGYIDDAMSQIPLAGEMTPYAIFMSSLKFSYYPILTLVFILILIKTQKDYGPMKHAEHRARTTGAVSSAKTESEDEPDMEDLSPVEGSPLKWQYAVIPVLTVIFVTIFGLLDTGLDGLHGSITEIKNIPNTWGNVWSNLSLISAEENPSFFNKLGTVIGSADSYAALLWASMSGLVVSILMTVAGKVIKLFDTMHYMVTGFKTMVPALLILTLAWSLAYTTEELHTADYLSHALSGNVSPYLIPIIVFVLSAFIAFSTGSSWSTMSILYPIAIPTTYAVCTAAGMDAASTLDLILNVIATVLAASVLGDHCSPISDTTILSSLASDCNHIDHVRTQLPYALTVGILSLICVGLAGVIGGSWIVNILILLVAIAVLYGIVAKFGTKITDQGAVE